MDVPVRHSVTVGVAAGEVPARHRTALAPEGQRWLSQGGSTCVSLRSTTGLPTDTQSCTPRRAPTKHGAVRLSPLHPSGLIDEDPAASLRSPARQPRSLRCGFTTTMHLGLGWQRRWRIQGRIRRGCGSALARAQGFRGGSRRLQRRSRGCSGTGGVLATRREQAAHEKGDGVSAASRPRGRPVSSFPRSA